MDLMELLGGDPDEEQQVALMEALRGAQANQGQRRAEMERTLGQQRSQATGLRNLSLLTSLGANPLLRGIQQASGEQGAQMENLAARTEQRMGGGMDPLSLVRAQQAQERLKQARAGLLAQESRFTRGQEQSAEQRELDRRSREKAAAIQAGDKATQQKLETESSLRKEYGALPEVKDFSGLATSYANLLESSKDMSGPGGVATIFNFMKMLDPGVAVMEGDVQLIRNSGGKAAAFANLYEQALSGNPLPDKVRKDLVRQATTIYQNRKKQVDSLANQYGGIAEQIGVSPDRVLVQRAPDIDLSPAPVQPQATPPAPAPQKGEGPRIVSVKGMKPGDLVKSLQEGETVRVPMGGGKYQVVRKKNGKLVKVKE